MTRSCRASCVDGSGLLVQAVAVKSDVPMIDEVMIIDNVVFLVMVKIMPRHRGDGVLIWRGINRAVRRGKSSIALLA